MRVEHNHARAASDDRMRFTAAVVGINARADLSDIDKQAQAALATHRTFTAAGQRTSPLHDTRRE